MVRQLHYVFSLIAILGNAACDVHMDSPKDEAQDTARPRPDLDAVGRDDEPFEPPPANCEPDTPFSLRCSGHLADDGTKYLLASRPLHCGTVLAGVRYPIETWHWAHQAPRSYRVWDSTTGSMQIPSPEVGEHQVQLAATDSRGRHSCLQERQRIVVVDNPQYEVLVETLVPHPRAFPVVEFDPGDSGFLREAEMYPDGPPWGGIWTTDERNAPTVHPEYAPDATRKAAYILHATIPIRLWIACESCHTAAPLELQVQIWDEGELVHSEAYEVWGRQTWHVATLRPAPEGVEIVNAFYSEPIFGR